MLGPQHQIALGEPCTQVELAPARSEQRIVYRIPDQSVSEQEIIAHATDQEMLDRSGTGIIRIVD
jgi:hypothetical protein